MASTYQELAPRDPHSKTGRVWRLAEEITRAKGRRAARAEVIGAYVAEGGNPDTASTQYWHWKRAYESEQQRRGKAEGTPEKHVRSAGSAQLTIGPGGRVVIPVEMRAAMEIGPDGKVTARVVDGELRIFSWKTAIRRAQEAVRGKVPSGVNLADELMAERRAEAQMEDAS